MAYSWQIENGTAGQETLDINIEYLSQDDIYLSIDNVNKLVTEDYTWVSASVIRLNIPLLGDEVVKVIRITDRSKLWISFSEGAPFDRTNIDEQNKQFLFISQEISEGVGVTGFNNDINMNDYRIINLGTPINDADAATKSYVDKFTKDAIASGDRAEEAALEAKQEAEFAKQAADDVKQQIGSQGLVKSVSGKAGNVVLDAGDSFYNASEEYKKDTVGTALQEINESIQDVKVSVIPLFTVQWWAGSRTSIPAGYVAADGQLLPIATYVDAAAGLASGVVPTVTEDEWISNKLKRACYVYNTTAGVFRMPDYNGVYKDSIGGLFLRGGSDIGNIVKDGVGDVAVPVLTTTWNQGVAPNRFDSKKYLSPATSIMSNEGWNAIGDFGVVGTVHNNNMNLGNKETVPLHINGCWIVRLFGYASGIGKADATQLATDVAFLLGEISLLKAQLNTPKYTEVYLPNSTPTAPASAAINTVYYLDNPFPSENIITKVLFYVDNRWGTAGPAAAWGCSADLDQDLDMIVVQTGATGLVQASNSLVGSLRHLTPNITTCPIKVQCWRV